MKEQYYDEEFNKFRGTLKIYQNRLRNAQENRETLLRKREKMNMDLENVKKEMHEAEL